MRSWLCVVIACLPVYVTGQIPNLSNPVTEKAVELGIQKYQEVQNDFLVNQYTFNAKGQLIDEVAFDPKRRAFKHHFAYTYGVNGSLVEQKVFETETDETIKNYFFFATDPAGNITITESPTVKEKMESTSYSEKVYSSDSLLLRESYFRFGKHNISREMAYYPDGIVKHRLSYRGEERLPKDKRYYNEQGKLLINESYKGDGALYRRRELKYDANGEKIAETQFDGQNNKLVESYAELDKKGRIIAQYRWRSGNAEPDKYMIWEYDKKGRHIHTRTTLNYSSFYDEVKEFSYAYDEEDRVIVEIKNKRNVLIKKTYDYSKAGELTVTDFISDATTVQAKEALKQPDLFRKRIAKTTLLASGLEIREVRFNSVGEPLAITEMNYDAAGNETSRKKLAGDGTEKAKFLMTYSKTNKLIEYQEFRPKPKGTQLELFAHNTFEFDSLGKPLLESKCTFDQLNAGKKICTKVEYTYTKQGELATQTEWTGEGKTGEWIYTYDDAGKLLQYKSLYGTCMYSYDEKKQMIGQKCMNRKGEVLEHYDWKYTYF